MKYKIIITTVVLITAVLTSNLVFGQPFNPPDGGAGAPVGAPIDGGISVLIAAGIALIGRKYYKNKKSKEE